jgi:hypothetical protein
VLANECQVVDSLPQAVQVAWVSPVRKRVGLRGYIEVVRVADLRAFVGEQGRDPVRALQAIGAVGRKGHRGLFPRARRYKVTFFDIDSPWLCRSLAGQDPGTTVAGLVVCPKGQLRGGRFYTGCGYARDSKTDGRGLDVYRIRWRDAVRRGFCVMPLDRFLEGA